MNVDAAAAPLPVVPSRLAFTPDVALGRPLVSSGGQVPAHGPLQVDWLRPSASNR